MHQNTVFIRYRINGFYRASKREEDRSCSVRIMFIHINMVHDYLVLVTRGRQDNPWKFQIIYLHSQSH
jgi:hypothetical protein